jgi:excisionase family DNA binding protein
MEKICIVEKRKRHLRERTGAASFVPTSGNASQESAGEIVRNKSKIDDHWKSQGTERPGTSLSRDKDDGVSLELTPEQSSYLLSNKMIEYLSVDTSHDIIVNTDSTDDRYIIFKFHLNTSGSVRLLKMNQVCEMLQVSRRFLSNLVKSKKIKSYKMGGLRRFSFDDVLTFLAESEDNQKNI